MTKRRRSYQINLPALTMLANNPYDDYKDASFNSQRHALPAIRKALKAAPAP